MARSRTAHILVSPLIGAVAMSPWDPPDSVAVKDNVNIDAVGDRIVVTD
jgi:hypothetical protein